MNKAFINNGLKGIRERIISDGVYVISTDSSYNQVLSIIGKSDKPDESLNFAKRTNEAYQFFFIKYYDQFDYYTIMALHSHLYLGVEKKGDSNYNNTLIMQNPMTEDHLAKWEIIFDDGYYFQLKDLNYNLQYKEETKICIIAKKIIQISNDFI